MASFRAFLNSPVGPKTTHFWGPVANWGFVIAVCALFHDHSFASCKIVIVQLNGSYFVKNLSVNFAGAGGHEKKP